MVTASFALLRTFILYCEQLTSTAIAVLARDGLRNRHLSRM